MHGGAVAWRRCRRSRTWPRRTITAAHHARPTEAHPLETPGGAAPVAGPAGGALLCHASDSPLLAPEIESELLALGEPVVLDDIWLPAGLFEGLSVERMSSYAGPMYGLFESEFGVRMIRAEEKIRAVAADEAQARLLSLPLGTPLLSVERLSMTYADQPVEFRRGLYHTAAHYYRNELS